MVYRQTFVPGKKNHTIEIPERFFGKKIEVIVVELESADTSSYPSPPIGKKVSVTELFEGFGANQDFPSIDKIRAKAWPSKW
jgi:hypothetical protein